jgi:hypothetical protein
LLIIFEKYKGEWAIAFMAEREHQQFLVDTDERFYVSPYAGKHGWLSMKIGAGVDWAQVKIADSGSPSGAMYHDANAYRASEDEQAPARATVAAPPA